MSSVSNVLNLSSEVATDKPFYIMLQKQQNKCMIECDSIEQRLQQLQQQILRPEQLQQTNKIIYKELKKRCKILYKELQQIEEQIKIATTSIPDLIDLPDVDLMPVPDVTLDQVKGLNEIFLASYNKDTKSINYRKVFFDLDKLYPQTFTIMTLKEFWDENKNKILDNNIN